MLRDQIIRIHSDAIDLLTPDSLRSYRLNDHTAFEQASAPLDISRAGTANVLIQRFLASADGYPFDIQVDVSGGYDIWFPIDPDGLEYSAGSATRSDCLRTGDILLGGQILLEDGGLYLRGRGAVRISLSFGLMGAPVDGRAAAVRPRGTRGGIRVDRDPITRQLVRAMLAGSGGPGPLTASFVDSLGKALLIHLTDASNTLEGLADDRRADVKPLPRWRLRRVLEHVEAHYARDLPLGELSELVGLSKMHFAAQFRVSVGMSPHRFVLQRRIQRAQELLTDPSQALQEVASAVGFRTNQHFINVFRRIVGDSPGRWRVHSRRSTFIGSPHRPA